MEPRRGARFKKGAPSHDLTAEADRFRAERIQMQLSTEPVDEAAAEDLLCQAYALAGLDAPGHIHWLDGPLELVAILAADNPWLAVAEQYREQVQHCAWDDARLDRDEIAYLTSSRLESVDHRVGQLRRLATQRSNARVKTVGGLHPQWGVEGGVWGRVVSPIWDAVRTEVGERI